MDIDAGVDNTAPFPDLKLKGYIYNVAAVGYSFGFDFSSKNNDNSSKVEYRHHDILIGISSKFFIE